MSSSQLTAIRGFVDGFGVGMFGKTRRRKIGKGCPAMSSRAPVLKLRWSWSFLPWNLELRYAQTVSPQDRQGPSVVLGPWASVILLWSSVEKAFQSWKLWDGACSAAQHGMKTVACRPTLPGFDWDPCIAWWAPRLISTHRAATARKVLKHAATVPGHVCDAWSIIHINPRTPRSDSTTF